MRLLYNDTLYSIIDNSNPLNKLIIQHAHYIIFCNKSIFQL